MEKKRKNDHARKREEKNVAKKKQKERFNELKKRESVVFPSPPHSFVPSILRLALKLTNRATIKLMATSSRLDKT